MEDKERFLSQVIEDETLTADLPDNLAGPVLKFAQTLAAEIARVEAEPRIKEEMLTKCMMHIRNFSKAFAECLDNPTRPTNDLETEIVAAISASTLENKEE